MSLLSQTAASSPLFQNLLARRGLADASAIDAFLAPSLTQLHDPFGLKGMKQAVDRLQTAFSKREKILVHGDYDVDGVTGAAIISRTLALCDAVYTAFLPDRHHDGYGVSAEAIRRAAKDGATLLVTVDCGITAREQIQVAVSLGMDVIILDHHRIPPEGIPEPAIVINPQQTDCEYVFGELTAGGLAFKLSQALIGEKAFAFLDLTALSTVADVAPLIGENRVLVKFGLEQLGKSPNIGLRALADCAGMRGKQWNSSHLGFMLGPRINASGRMGTPDMALRILMTDSGREAVSLASALEEENKARQREERQTTKEAIAEVERSVHFNREKLIVVGKEGWHQGVIGIVASRLVERFHRPAIVIAFQGEFGKGSGRSIKKFNLFEAVAQCRDLLEEFGGHEQAMGLSIRKENFPVFKKAVNEKLLNTIPAEIFDKTIKEDLEIRLSDLSSTFVEELKLLEPHGAGNPRPVFFSKRVSVKSKPVRLNSQSLQFWVTDQDATYEAKWTDRLGRDISWLEQGTVLDIYYSVKSRNWQGQDMLSLEIKDLRPT